VISHGLGRQVHDKTKVDDKRNHRGERVGSTGREGDGQGISCATQIAGVHSVCGDGGTPERRKARTGVAGGGARKTTSSINEREKSKGEGSAETSPGKLKKQMAKISLGGRSGGKFGSY